MSHFTHMKTQFQNLFYLKKALDKLTVVYKQDVESSKGMCDLIIPQLNGSDIKFSWTGQEYELTLDTSFWEQPYPIESFIDKVGQQYAGEVVIGESNKMGFQPIKYQKNNDGSNVLILERWSS